MKLYHVSNENGGHCDGHKWWKDAGLSFRYQHLGFAYGLPDATPKPKVEPVEGWDDGQDLLRNSDWLKV